MVLVIIFKATKAACLQQDLTPRLGSPEPRALTAASSEWPWQQGREQRVYQQVYSLKCLCRVTDYRNGLRESHCVTLHGVARLTPASVSLYRSTQTSALSQRHCEQDTASRRHVDREVWIHLIRDPLTTVLVNGHNLLQQYARLDYQGNDFAKHRRTVEYNRYLTKYQHRILCFLLPGLDEVKLR